MYRLANAHHRQTDGRTDDSPVPIADHIAYSSTLG